MFKLKLLIHRQLQVITLYHAIWLFQLPEVPFHGDEDSSGSRIATVIIYVREWNTNTYTTINKPDLTYGLQ